MNNTFFLIFIAVIYVFAATYKDADGSFILLAVSIGMAIFFTGRFLWKGKIK